MVIFDNIWSIVVVALGILISERIKSNYVLICLSVIFVAQLIDYFLPTLFIFLIITLFYIPFGVLYSFWKYRNYSMALLNKNKDITDDYQRNLVRDKLHPKKMVSSIMVWILIWPLSMVNSIINGILSSAESLVTDVFYRVYLRIHTSALENDNIPTLNEEVDNV